MIKFRIGKLGQHYGFGSVGYVPSFVRLSNVTATTIIFKLDLTAPTSTSIQLMEKKQHDISLEEYFRMPVRSDYFTRSQVHRSSQRLGSIDCPQDLSFLDGPWYYESKKERLGRVDLVSGKEWKKSCESNDTLEYESEDTVVYEREGDVEIEQPSEHPARTYAVCADSPQYQEVLANLLIRYISYIS
jgi:hypothetical protein